MKQLKVFEMFSGYGGASWGLLKAGIPFECVGISEIDKYAIQCYNQNFPNVKNFGDCSKINTKDLPDFNLLTGGFPCVDVSIAGSRDLSKGRTNLYQEILRIARDKKPKYMLLENVKGLLSMEIDERKLHLKIVGDLNKIGYGVCWKVLNSKDYGIPQNRERIWFVCKLGGWNFMEFTFPNKKPLKIFLKDILEKEPDKKYYLSEKALLGIMKSNFQERKPLKKLEVCRTLKVGGDVPCIKIDNENKSKIIQLNKEGIYPEERIYSEEGISPILTCSIAKNLTIKTRSIKEAISIAKEISNEKQKPVQLDLMHLQHGELRPLSTYIPQDLDVHRCLQAGEPKEVLVEPKMNKNIRRLTPKECFRLMGFLDDEINLDGISESQQYKLAGNGWDINLVSKIFKQMFKHSKKN